MSEDTEAFNPGRQPWLIAPVTAWPRGEAREAAFPCVIATLTRLGLALDLSASELAGILGISQGEWLALSRHPFDVGCEPRLDLSLRLLCELLGSVLLFAGEMDGARWLRTDHPVMEDSPLGRLIRSPDALPWLSDVLFAERGR